MKKIFRTFCAFFLCVIGVSGCAPAASSPPEPEAVFTCTAEIEYGEMRLGGRFSTPAVGIYDLEIAYPQETSGLSFHSDGQTLSVAFQGMQHDFPSDAFPTASLPESLFSALRTACMRDALTLKASNQSGFLMSDDTGRYEFLLAGGNGRILEARDTASGLHVKFFDFESAGA